MKRRWSALCCVCAFAMCGCLSTSPCADLLDHCWPGKVRAGRVAPYGGVCIPQGPVACPPPGAALPSVPAIVVPVIPPPAPLPESTGGIPAAPAPPPPVMFPR